MFNAVSVACAPRPRPRSLSHRRDIKYSAAPFADVSVLSKERAFTVHDDESSSSVNLTNVNFTGDKGLRGHCQK
jgi:hypothetical protein